MGAQALRWSAAVEGFIPYVPFHPGASLGAFTDVLQEVGVGGFN